MIINILIDNNSWIIPYGHILLSKLKELDHDCVLFFNQNDVRKGDVLFLLGCIKKFKKLYLNKKNVVIHESKLPGGKGWSPLTWQILEGKNNIPVTLFEATDEIDSGKIYLSDNINLSGYELYEEIKKKTRFKNFRNGC